MLTAKWPQPNQSTVDLFATTFGAFKSGTVQAVRDVGGQLSAGSGGVQVAPVVGKAFGLQWPNEMTSHPSEPLRFLFGDGFLLPGQETGAVVEVRRGAAGTLGAARLGASESGWFYHKAFYYDVNQDGLLDVVTARAYSSFLSGNQGELVWLEAPAYTRHTIAAGPDINFDILPLNGTSSPFVVYAAEFFGKQLRALHVGKDGKVLGDNTIMSNAGEMYAAVVADLHNTGDVQLVCTNYHYSGAGSLYVFPIDKQNPLKPTNKFVIYDNFKNLQVICLFLLFIISCISYYFMLTFFLS